MVMPRYPIYIVSKKRHDTRYTAKSLEKMKIPYYIVVEAFEVDAYIKTTDPEYGTVLTLPEEYLRNYDTCDSIEYGTKSVGPGAARNFCWDHSISIGAKSHWVMDDNIEGFYRYYRGKRIRSYSPGVFSASEDFVDRYENVPVSGLQYRFFCVPSDNLPPYIKNTRIYSCLLIRNDCKHRWRGRYNEDTDLSLRVLKDGDCTIQFNAFLQAKIGTQVLAGGNTDAFYAKEGTSAKSMMLKELHPDVTELVVRFGRHHHHVNYIPFRKNKLIKKSGVTINNQVNEYSMVLKQVDRKSGECVE